MQGLERPPLLQGLDGRPAPDYLRGKSGYTGASYLPTQINTLPFSIPWSCRGLACTDDITGPLTPWIPPCREAAISLCPSAFPGSPLSSGLQKTLSSHFFGPGKAAVLLPLASSFCNIFYGTLISSLIRDPYEGALLELSEFECAFGFLLGP